jgi:hypothetical protein
VLGTRLDYLTPERGGSPGCVQSGRRWHRRIPAVV